MPEISAIKKFSSPWVSAIVLVRKKDGNSHTVNGAYSLPCRDETLDCLNSAKIFTSLDLKSGYWQVELDEANKPLTAFTVGPLQFYEHKRMLFGLTNAPATFQ